MYIYQSCFFSPFPPLFLLLMPLSILSICFSIHSFLFFFFLFSFRQLLGSMYINLIFQSLFSFTAAPWSFFTLCMHFLIYVFISINFLTCPIIHSFSATSPFQGTDNDVRQSILQARYNFNSQVWGRVSQSARDLIMRLLVRDPALRLDATAALRHSWLQASVGRVVGREWAGLRVPIIQ